MNEYEFDEKHSDDGSQQKEPVQSQNQGVVADPPAVDDDGQEPEFDNNFVENTVSDMGDEEDEFSDGDNVVQKNQGEQKGVGETDTGNIPYNKVRELERKIKNLETKLSSSQSQQTPPQQQSPQQSPPSPPPPQFNQFQQPQQGNQPNTPLDYQLEITDREALQALQGGDGRKYHELTMKVAGLQAQKIIADQDKSRRELEMKTRVCTEYPEVQNNNSLLAQWADHYFRTTYFNNPNDIERAVRDAAEHLSIQPRSAIMTPALKVTQQRLPRSQAVAPVTEKPSTQQPKSLPELTPLQKKIASEWGQDPAKVAAMKRKRNY